MTISAKQSLALLTIGAAVAAPIAYAAHPDTRTVTVASPPVVREVKVNVPGPTVTKVVQHVPDSCASVMYDLVKYAKEANVIGRGDLLVELSGDGVMAPPNTDQITAAVGLSSAHDELYKLILKRQALCKKDSGSKLTPHLEETN